MTETKKARGDMTSAEIKLYDLGYNAARYGEKRQWCVDRGEICVQGFDDYWDYIGLGE